MLSVEKVYDELYGMIEDLKKKIAALSSGDEVTITPALESGVKVADYTIGEDTGSLYAPAEKSGVYSTDETEVGIYKGSPLYRKVFTSATALTGTSTTIDISSLNVDIPVKVFATVLYTDASSSYHTMLPINDSTNYAFVDTVSDTTITIRHTSGFATNRANGGYALIFEYTKKPEEAKNTRSTKKK